MSKVLQIAPSILGADFGRLADELAEISEGGADLVHVDVMDGRFVPNITFGAVIVSHLRRLTTLPLDVHMMVSEPERHLQAIADAGADFITVHCEATVHLQRTLQQVRALGKRAGVALNPSTPPSAIQYTLPDLDLVLVMTVNPGFMGQSFLPQVLPKIADLRARVDHSGLDISIEVDGGIGPKTAPDVVRAGAGIVVAGAAIFGQPNKRAAIRQIRRAVQESDLR